MNLIKRKSILTLRAMSGHAMEKKEAASDKAGFHHLSFTEYLIDGDPGEVQLKCICWSNAQQL